MKTVESCLLFEQPFQLKSTLGLVMSGHRTPQTQRALLETPVDSFWQYPPPGANWSIGIPHLFQNTAGIEEKSNASSFRHINPNHSGASASSQEGSPPGDTPAMGSAVGRFWIASVTMQGNTSGDASTIIFSTFQRSFTWWLSRSSGTFHAQL